ncbi:DNA repair protein XRCC1 [Anopheles marshallii]|uniref:DNA repair protein XRCC1 n=1 Tax=Anopheles marshallii TaxID=1521116 RepID=UPI00237B8852|nr:DNA repair protein XRCC1 [Anopheles marshallii]
MPSVSIKAIESFSSEDPNYPASNLVKPGNRKWKCRQAGEQQAFVVLRLGEPTQISGIDIGNEHAALIEVLVARSGPSNPPYSEILLATKFMNAVDSRNSTGTNGVQCFNSSALIPSVASEKWDLVKFICTQPFNSRVRYGLTFVALHTSSRTETKDRKSLVPEKFQQQIQEEAIQPKPSVGLNLGRFKLREESPDSDDAGFSNIFSRWKNNNAAPSSTSARSPTVSALMRDSNTPKALEKNIPTPGSVRSVAKQRPKPQMFLDSDDEESDSKANTSVKVNRNDESVLYDAEDEKPAKKPHDSARNEGGIAKRQFTTSKPEANNVAKVSSSKFKDFLNFTGSDQQPKRNDERKNSSSTPVVARKPNHSTSSHLDHKDAPKKIIDQARPPLSIEKQTVPSSKRLSSPTKSPGNHHDSTTPTMKKPKLTIVDDDSDPEVRKPVRYKPFGKLLENVVLVISGIQNPDRANIRSQALAMGAKYKPDWDSSCTHLICAYKNTPKYNQVQGKGKIVKQDWIEKCYTNRKRLSWRKFALDTAEANVSDSEGEIVDILNKPPDVVQPAESRIIPSLVEKVQEEAVMLHELSDTDEEPGVTIARKVYDKSTEDEGDHNENNVAGSLDFFKGKKFYLHQELGAVDKIKLEKYIETFSGAVSNEMAGVDYVIARSKHVLPFDCRAELVKPLWVYECNDMECLIPVNRYRIV